MTFSIIWAAAGPAYIGMIYGAMRLASQSSISVQSLFGMGVGAFMGGAMALPLVATNLISAWLASRLTRDQPFATQFGAFALLSFVFYYVLLRLMDQGLRTAGGIDLSRNGLAIQAGFVAASLALALVLMVLGIRPRNMWSS